MNILLFLLQVETKSQRGEITSSSYASHGENSDLNPDPPETQNSLSQHIAPAMVHGTHCPLLVQSKCEFANQCLAQGNE